MTWYYLTGGVEVTVRHDKNHQTVRQEGSQERTSRYKLKIRNLSYTEITTFTCRAENEVGSKEAYIEVTGETERLQTDILSTPFRYS